MAVDNQTLQQYTSTYLGGYVTNFPGNSAGAQDAALSTLNHSLSNVDGTAAQKIHNDFVGHVLSQCPKEYAVQQLKDLPNDKDHNYERIVWNEVAYGGPHGEGMRLSDAIHNADAIMEKMKGSTTKLVASSILYQHPDLTFLSVYSDADIQKQKANFAQHLHDTLINAGGNDLSGIYNLDKEAGKTSAGTAKALHLTGTEYFAVRGLGISPEEYNMLNRWMLDSQKMGTQDFGKHEERFVDLLADKGVLQNVNGQLTFATPTRSGESAQRASMENLSNLLKASKLDPDVHKATQNVANAYNVSLTDPVVTPSGTPSGAPHGNQIPEWKQEGFLNQQQMIEAHKVGIRSGGQAEKVNAWIAGHMSQAHQADGLGLHKLNPNDHSDLIGSFDTLSSFNNQLGQTGNHNADASHYRQAYQNLAKVIAADNSPEGKAAQDELNQNLQYLKANPDNKVSATKQDNRVGGGSRPLHITSQAASDADIKLLEGAGLKIVNGKLDADSLDRIRQVIDKGQAGDAYHKFNSHLTNDHIYGNGTAHSLEDPSTAGKLDKAKGEDKIAEALAKLGNGDHRVAARELAGLGYDYTKAATPAASAPQSGVGSVLDHAIVDNTLNENTAHRLANKETIANAIYQENKDRSMKAVGLKTSDGLQIDSAITTTPQNGQPITTYTRTINTDFGKSVLQYAVDVDANKKVTAVHAVDKDGKTMHNWEADATGKLVQTKDTAVDEFLKNDPAGKVYQSSIAGIGTAIAKDLTPAAPPPDAGPTARPGSRPPTRSVLMPVHIDPLQRQILAALDQNGTHVLDKSGARIEGTRFDLDKSKVKDEVRYDSVLKIETATGDNLTIKTHLDAKNPQKDTWLIVEHAGSGEEIKIKGKGAPNTADVLEKIQAAEAKRGLVRPTAGAGAP